MEPVERRLGQIAAGQRGAFSRAQASNVGVSDRQLRQRVANGLLVQVGPNAFRFLAAPSTLVDELSALLRDIGEPAFAAGPTAAALHGIDGFGLRRPFHVVVPRRRNSRRVGVVVHTSKVLDLVDVVKVDDIAVTSPVRTIIDLARWASRAQLRNAVESLVNDRLGSETALHRRIVALRSRGRYGLPTLMAVLAEREVGLGAESWLEREYLRLLALAGLPRPETQQILSRAGDRWVRVDCRFPGTRIVVELLGYEFHRTAVQMDRDVQRMNALVADGYQPYQFTYRQVTEQPDEVVASTSRALIRRAA